MTEKSSARKRGNARRDRMKRGEEGSSRGHVKAGPDPAACLLVPFASMMGLFLTEKLARVKVRNFMPVDVREYDWSGNPVLSKAADQSQDSGKALNIKVTLF